MEREKNLIIKYPLNFTICILFLIGYIGHFMDFSRGFFISLTWIFLILINGIIIIKCIDWSEKKNYIVIGMLYLFTFMSEAIGVHTGWIFGEYYYTNVLGFQVLSVPLIISLNWMTIFLGLYALINLTPFKNNLWFYAASGGILAIIFDYFLEKVAIRFQYWIWAENTPPLQNYAAWFIISFFGLIILHKFSKLIRFDLLVTYILVQTIFFILLSLGY